MVAHKVCNHSDFFLLFSRLLHFALSPVPTLFIHITCFPHYEGTLDYMCPQRLRGEPYNFEVSKLGGCSAH